MRYWKISPGKRAVVWDKFLSGSYIGIGWNDIGDMREFSSREQMIEEFYDVYPHSYPDQNSEFYYEMQKGDKVLAYGKKGILALGDIVGDYYHEEEEDEFYSWLPFHRRKVNWNVVPETRFPIEELPDSVQKKLMRPRTIVELSEEDWRYIEEGMRGGFSPEESGVEAEEAPAFEIFERQVINYLAETPSAIEKGLELVGREYDTKEVGRIDLLFKDAESKYLVVETNKNRESDEVIGQILRYIGWVKKKLGPNVRGLIITRESDPLLEYAVYSVQDLIELKFYRVKFELFEM